MWMYFYKSERIRDLALAINPELEDEIVDFIENIDELNAEAEAATSKLLSALVTIKAKGKMGNLYKNSHQVKKGLTQNMITRTIENYLTEDKYTQLDDNTTLNDIYKIKKIVRIEGRFKLNIEGRTSTERVENFDKSHLQEWEGKFKHISVNFITSRESFTTEKKRPTPVLQCLASNSKTIRLDGFAIFNDVEENNISVTPILLGNFIDL